jgi:hypothetical protein
MPTNPEVLSQQPKCRSKNTQQPKKKQPKQQQQLKSELEVMPA